MTLGRYRLIEQIGEGGMGTIYRAEHLAIGRTVAIKVMHPDAAANRGLVSRFFYEARAANAVRQENVIEIYDFVDEPGRVYFVMELLDGKDLHDTVHAPGGHLMEPKRAAAILRQVGLALHAAHQHDIVHRDVKPENIFLTQRDHRPDFVKLVDFGVAKLERDDGCATSSGALLGTPEYMSPEQARGLPVDGRADIYALGCVAYEMLTRRQVFGGGTQAEVLVRQIRTTPSSPDVFVKEIPPTLAAVVMRALAKDPRERQQTALQFVQELDRAIDCQLRLDNGSDAAADAGCKGPASPLQLRSRGGDRSLPLAVVAIAMLVVGGFVVHQLSAEAVSGVVAPLTAAAPNGDQLEPDRIPSASGVVPASRARPPRKGGGQRARLTPKAATIDPFSGSGERPRPTLRR